MNRNTLIASLFSLMLGAVGGVFGGYFFAKNKFLKQADKEVESVKKCLKEHYESKLPAKTEEKGNDCNEPSIVVDIPNSSVNKPEEKEIKQYKDYAKQYNQQSSESIVEKPTSSIVTPKPESKPKIKKTKRPYLISPDEYMASEYEAESFYWFNDRILSDDHGKVIEDIDGLLGPGNIDKFGQYRDDVIVIRDDENKTDYEVLFQDMKYSDKFPDGPINN